MLFNRRRDNFCHNSFLSVFKRSCSVEYNWQNGLGGLLLPDISIIKNTSLWRKKKVSAISSDDIFQLAFGKCSKGNGIMKLSSCHHVTCMLFAGHPIYGRNFEPMAHSLTLMIWNSIPPDYILPHHILHTALYIDSPRQFSLSVRSFSFQLIHTLEVCWVFSRSSF